MCRLGVFLFRLPQNSNDNLLNQHKPIDMRRVPYGEMGSHKRAKGMADKVGTSPAKAVI
ncbi:MAG: hypothetical protein OXD42_10480 [Rhodospirillaceae bacterium]|nr:hypothetical protein [Rhodospirillaceae bacterium]